MKAVLASLKPYYYYLVGEGIKTVEVRKTFPKSEDWNKDIYFYMSRDEKSFARIPKEFQEKYRRHFGKVGLRFVCDRIYTISANYDIPTNCNQYECGWLWTKDDACLSFELIDRYLDGKNGYGWHISDLVIYDNPRELMSFGKYFFDYFVSLKRPFQSWGYIYA